MDEMNKVKVSEIFYSLQGEGPAMGHPSIFVRLSGCNLKCKSCFGEVGGRKKPNVISIGKGNKCDYVHLSNVKKGDHILTFDEDFNVVETIVKETHSRLVDKWLRITIDGHQYFVTHDHPFMTPRGVMLAKDLQIDDDIYDVSTKDITKFRMTGDRNPMKNKETSRKKADHTDYVLMGHRLSDTIRKQIEDGTYVRRPEMTTEMRERISIRMLGPLNPNWGGGSKIPNYSKLYNRIREEGLVCSSCSSNSHIEIHHIDKNPENDTEDNLLVLCKSCHTKTHKKGYNFWNGQRRDGKQLVNAIQHNGKKVEHIKEFDRSTYRYPSITPAPLEVFNLTCEPHNTYFLDNMWVHNCDTPIKDKFEEVDPISVNRRIKLYKDQHTTARIVITGGEPFLQMRAVQTILNDWPHVEKDVETNGTIDVLPEVLNQFRYVVVCPKRDNFPTVKDRISFFKKWGAVPNCFIKIVVGTLPWMWSEQEIKDVLKLSEVSPEKVYLMPGGAKDHELVISARNCFKVAMRLGTNYSDRLHIRVQGAK